MAKLSGYRMAITVALLPFLAIGTSQSADMQKLSVRAAEAGARGARHFVLVVRQQAPVEEARQAALRQGLVLREHPSLRPDHLLAEGDFEAVKRAAEADEIAYVFPASDELANGVPLYSCSGALARLLIGEYTERIGGWPAASSGAQSYSLGVFFSNLPDNMPTDVARAQILSALNVWSQAVGVEFHAAARADEPRAINVLFVRRDHGDGSPFDGPGGLLAHTFYPAPPNPEAVAGDIHFDADETWGTGDADAKDLFSVALHESGHALGLGHSDQPGAVMYPYYTKTRMLTAEDITAIRKLYPARPMQMVRPAYPRAR